MVDFLGTLNKVEEIIENPCDGDWWVYVKTAVPAAGNALWMLLIPSPDEILEEYLDPSKTRGRAKRGFQGQWRRFTTGGGGKGRGRRGGFPDPDGIVAEWLPGRQLFAGRRISALEHIFWTTLNTADRIAWYWLLIDVTSDFIYEWHSGIMESSCEEEPQPAAGYWSRSAGALPELGGAPPSFGYWTEAYKYGCTQFGARTIILNSPLTVTCFYDITLDNFKDETNRKDVGLQLQTENELVYSDIRELEAPPNGTANTVFSVTRDNIKRITWQADTVLGSSGSYFGFTSFIGST